MVVCFGLPQQWAELGPGHVTRGGRKHVCLGCPSLLRIACCPSQPGRYVSALLLGVEVVSVQCCTLHASAAAAPLTGHSRLNAAAV